MTPSRPAGGRPWALLLMTICLLSQPSLQALSTVPETELADSFGKLKSKLLLALRSGESTAVDSAIQALLTVQDKASTKFLLKCCAEYPQPMHDPLLKAFVASTSEKVVETIYAEARKSDRSLVRVLCYEVICERTDERRREALLEAFDGKDRVVVAVLFSILSSREEKASVDVLIEACNAPTGRSRRRIPDFMEALQKLTGKSMESPEDWQKWWTPARPTFEFPSQEKGKKKGKTAVIERLERRGDGEFIAELVEGDILVVPGAFDEVQSVLKALGLPFTEIGHAQLNPKFLKPTAVLVFNCDEGEHRLTREHAKLVRAFVKAGGYLFTSDWELQNVLLGGFGESFGVGQFTGPEEFDVAIEPDPNYIDHPLLKDVFPANPFERSRFRWTIDPGSMLVNLKARKGAFPLVRSKELEQKHGSDLVAVEVIFGKGAILHVLSHFKKQRKVEDDGFALQQLLANFIVEKQKHRRAAVRKKK